MFFLFHNQNTGLNSWLRIYSTFYAKYTGSKHALSYFIQGGEIEKDAIRTVETDNDKEIIPNESDFLLGYSTAPGYAAYRNTQDGSLYIRKLCEVLQEYSKG